MIASSVQLFALGSYLVPKSVEGLSRDELLRAPQGTNPMIWIWGHLTNARCGLAMMLGVERERFHDQLFGRGAEIGANTEYPSEDEVRACWQQVSERLRDRYESLTAEELRRPSPRSFPVEDKSVAGTVNFLAFHEGYHCGQLAMLRKWLGQGQLVG